LLSSFKTTFGFGLAGREMSAPNTRSDYIMQPASRQYPLASYSTTQMDKVILTARLVIDSEVLK
jgi:hypothetical protein